MIFQSKHVYRNIVSGQIEEEEEEDNKHENNRIPVNKSDINLTDKWYKKKTD